MLFAGSDHFVFFFCQIVNKVEVKVEVDYIIFIILNHLFITTTWCRYWFSLYIYIYILFCCKIKFISCDFESFSNSTLFINHNFSESFDSFFPDKFLPVISFINFFIL